MGSSISFLIFKENRSIENSKESDKKLKMADNEEGRDTKKETEKNWKHPLFPNWPIREKYFLNIDSKEQKENIEKNIVNGNTHENNTAKVAESDILDKMKNVENRKPMENIKKENFYLFDESLNSNEVKHPCHAQWFLFWVFASYVSEHFSETEKKQIHSFYSNFPDQCIEGKAKNCYTQFMSAYPIKANNREELMMWLQMCENFCRQKANLPAKVFNYKKLLKRWRYDDGYL